MPDMNVSPEKAPKRTSGGSTHATQDPVRSYAASAPKPHQTAPRVGFSKNVK